MEINGADVNIPLMVLGIRMIFSTVGECDGSQGKATIRGSCILIKVC